MGSSAAVQEDHFNRGQWTNWQKSTTIQLTLKTGNSAEMSSERTSQCSFPLASPPCFSSLAHQLEQLLPLHLPLFPSISPSLHTFLSLVVLLTFSCCPPVIGDPSFIVSAPLCLTLSNSFSSLSSCLCLVGT